MFNISWKYLMVLTELIIMTLSFTFLYHVNRKNFQHITVLVERYFHPYSAYEIEQRIHELDSINHKLSQNIDSQLRKYPAKQEISLMYNSIGIKIRSQKCQLISLVPDIIIEDSLFSNIPLTVKLYGHFDHCLRLIDDLEKQTEMFVLEKIDMKKYEINPEMVLMEIFLTAKLRR